MTFTLGAISAVLMDAPAVRTSVVAREPATGSLAEGDLAACERGIGTANPVARVIMCADLWTSIAANQMMGLGVLLAKGDTLFAMFPILRSVIEHGAATTWVLDDEIDSRDRAKRAALAMLRSEEEMLKVVSKFSEPGNERKATVKRQLKALREEIRIEFGDLVAEGAPSIEGVTLPRPTAMIERFGERWGDTRQWSGMYDYFCATANHPSLTAFEYASRDESGEPNGFTAPSDLVRRLAQAGLVPFIKSMEHFCAYMGWDRAALDAYIDQINESMGEVFTEPSS